MSRFTATVLMATALLGVLLWIVLSMARDFARAPAEPLPMPTDEVAVEPDPSLPRIYSKRDLENWLAGRDAAGTARIENLQQWLSGLGFPSDYVSLLDGGQLPAAEAETDEVLLLALAGQGDIEAAQQLAELSMRSDPIAALEWFSLATVQGSVYAMQRSADLLATLASPELRELASDPEWQATLDKLNNASPNASEQALAWSIAAVIVGGYPVLTPEHAERIQMLAEPLNDTSIERACDTAQDFVLETATARRAQGGPVLSTDAPNFALTLAEPATAIPCEVPILPLVSIADCAATDFVGPQQQIWTAWLCPADG